MVENTSKLRLIFLTLTLVFVLFGVGLRFYHITSNDFIFFDEGYYLNFNRTLGDFVAQHRFVGLKDWLDGFNEDAPSKIADELADACWRALKV